MVSVWPAPVLTTARPANLLLYAAVDDLPGRPVVILKADPDKGVALREQFADITSGYHMNKKHWITVEGGGTVDEKLVKQLVTDSYELVAGELPRSVGTTV